MGNEDMFKKLGLADGCSADEMKGAMGRYMADMDAKEKAYADMEEKMKKMGDVDPDAAADKDKKMADNPADAAKMAEDKEAVAKMAKDLGLPAGSTAATVYAAYSAKTVPMSELADARTRLAALEAERVAEKQAALNVTYGELADRGIAAGYSQEKREDLIKFARADFDAAKSFVESLPGAKALTRYTAGGAPLNTARTDSPAVTMAEISGVRVPVTQGLFAQKARLYAKEHKVSLRDAQKAVIASDPVAAADFLGR